MNAVIFQGLNFLPEKQGLRAFALTLSFFVPFLFQSAQATSYLDERDAVYTGDYRHNETVIAKEDQKQRLKLALNYIREEAPRLTPGLPNYLHDPGEWAARGIRSFTDVFSMDVGYKDGTSIVATIVDPIASMMQPPPDDVSHAMWMTPDYNHKGFLPLHDAVIMGINSRHNVWDNKLQIVIHPFVGQNWHSTENYWGNEIAFNLGHPLEGEADKRSWGKIALRYTNGETDLMEHGRGFEMESSINFSPSVSLNAVARQDSGGNRNDYVFLKWTLSEFGK